MSPKLHTVSLAVFALGAVAGAQTASVRTSAHPTVRITATVDNAVTRALPGSHPVLGSEAVVGSRVAPTTLLPHLKLVLNSSAEQEAALQQLMSEQQDKNSPNYHKWLTPDAFGTYFGAAPADIAKISAWLGDQGLAVESVAKSGRLITFSGSAAQVEAAFHTEIHAVDLAGVAHIANTTDLEIPEALAGVVAGVARVNDIFPTRSTSRVSTLQIETARNGGAAADSVSSPLYGTATGTHFVSPGDAATIYNTTPLTSAGIDGTGQTISILAQSNIDLANVEEFRSIFGLKKNDPTVIVAGQDPGLNADDSEAYLDAEWAGAMAPNAAVNFIVSAPSLAGGGVDGAALYAVENNIGDIISLSYGGGETANGAVGTAYWNNLWEQAAAQGQTVFVSSGDSGAAGCDRSSSTYATRGYCVNALGSSAYNVAMGGSMFVDFNPAQYWGATGGTSIPFTNALSYIPEGAWNEGRLSNDYLNSAATAYATGSGIVGTGGGISVYTARPSWQTGSGIPSNTDAINVYSGTGIATGSPIGGLHRLVPDIVNISASNHDPALYCANSLCSVSSTGSLNNAGLVGGTSLATPVQASIQALINQKNGGRQGNILPILYSVARAQFAATPTACQANIGANGTIPAPPASTCNFYDIVYGSNIVPTAATGTAGIGFSAGAGFDEASGLGSVNAANLATNWSTVSLVATTTTFSLSPSVGVTHGAAQNLKVTVTPTGGSGTPTGDVALIASTSTPNGPRVYTLTAGSFSGLVSSAAAQIDSSGDVINTALPAGSYSVYVHYAGDGTYAPSDSTALPVTISKEGTAVSGATYNVTAAGYVYAQSSFPYGADVYLDTTVGSASGKGVPTGTLTYTISRGGSTVGTLVTTLDATGNTYLLAGQAFPSFYLKPNFAALAPGSYVVTAAYSGDASFTASSTTTSFTVTQLSPAVTFTVPANISSGTTAVFGYSIANPATAANPNTTVPATGTVTFTASASGGIANILGSCSLTAQIIGASNQPSATCSFSTAALTAAGTYIITANYSGDSNYAAASSQATLTVGALTDTTLALTGTGTASVGAIYTLRATMNPTAATGTVSFYDGTTFLGRATLSSGIATLALGASATGGGILTAATHNFSAVYSGSSVYNSSTGTLSTVIAKAATGLTLSAPSASTYGQVVIFSAYLSRSPTTSVAAVIQPTGPVNFYSDGALVASGTPVFDPGGYGYYAASGSTATLPAGTHTITATYAGDSNFSGSTSTLTPTLTVAQLTPTVSLTSTATVYNTSRTVILTATVLLPAALAAPTGTISFYNGNVLLGSVNATYSASVGGYVASYTATNQAAGIHNYKAVLGGDSNYAAATSNTLVVLFNTNNVWVANGNGTVSGLTNTGNALTPTGVSQGGTAIAIDGAGYVWSLNKSGNKVSEFDNSGNLINTFTGGGIATPTALAIDGSGLVWVSNATGTLSALSPTGAALSPSGGYKVSASGPTSINVDGSGNLWITNAGDNSVTEVIGAATPVTTPTTNAVKNNTLAAKP